MLHRSVQTEDKESRIGVHPELSPQHRTLALLHVELHVHERLVEILAHHGHREYVVRHVFARAAPTRVAIHEYQLSLCLCFVQCLLEGQILKVHALSPGV